MEALLKKIRQMSSGDSSRQELLKYLAIQETNFKLNADNMLPLVNMLSLPQHTLPTMFILSTRFDLMQTLNPTQWGDWVSVGIRFLKAFDLADALLDIKRLYKVANLLSYFIFVVSSNLQKGTLDELYSGLINVVNLTAKPGELTPLHAEITKLALVLKRPHLALHLISQDYCSVSKKQTGLDAKQVILFFYYGGSIWLGLKEYERAADYYSACISTPSIAIHAASVEAFKKLILVKLISKGVSASVPKFASGILQRYLRQIVDVYSDLAVVYTRETPQALKQFIEANAAVFSRDKNHGLIKQLLKARTRRLVQLLTNSYTTVSLTDIASQSATDPREVEHILLQMIEEGDLDARIDQEHGIVFFEERSDVGQYEAFESQAGRLLSLLYTADQRLKDLMLDPDYVRETLTMKEHGSGGPGLLSDLA